MKANMNQGDAVHFNSLELAASILAGASLALLTFVLLTSYITIRLNDAARKSTTHEFNNEQGQKTPELLNNPHPSAP